MKGVPVPSGAPAPLAPLPPRRLPQSVHFSMTRSVHFSVAIDMRHRDESDGGLGGWRIGGLVRVDEEFGTVMSPYSVGGAMIGREKRVLLRHYLEQGLSKVGDCRASGDGPHDDPSVDRGGRAGP